MDCILLRLKYSAAGLLSVLTCPSENGAVLLGGDVAGEKTNHELHLQYNMIVIYTEDID